MSLDVLPSDGWDAAQLTALLRGALTRLQHEAAVMNALNVFPVPDGDTGTNMSATLQAALVELRGDEATPGAVARAAARGALMGARGNGGVILSQWLRGLADGLEGCDRVTGPVLAHALHAAASVAYRAVTTPVEGTMLTVAREAAEAAATVADLSAVAVLDAALTAARASLTRTPDLLPILREAGVVDAGGHGMVAVLEGALRTARGQSPAEGDTVLVTRGVDRQWAADTERLHQDDSPGYGYCTEFLIQGQRLPVETLRAVMGTFGDSLLVVGDEELVRVHVHALDPGAPLSAAVRYGALLQIKIDNMEQQARRFLRQGDVPPVAARASRPLGVAAVVAGEGLAAVARSLGATVIPGGQTMNPSAAELLAGVEASGGETVILLPNNPNIVLTAQQAATLTERRIIVVPTTTVAQGIAALLALPPDAPAEEAVAAMTRAAGAVRTLEVTRATRTAVVSGVPVQEGEALVLLDGGPVAAAAAIPDAVAAALDCVDASSVQLVTIYVGAAATPAETEAVRAAVRARLSAAEVETAAGGQPHYPYILALE